MKIDKKLIIGIGYIISGVLVAIFKQEILRWICCGIGVLMIISGIVGFVLDEKNNVDNPLSSANNTFWIVCGVVLAVLSWLIIEAIQIIAGVFLIIYGIYYLGFAVLFDRKNILVYIDGILYILTGILIMFKSDVVFFAFGLLLALIGILELITCLFAKKQFIRQDTYSSSSNPNVIDVEVVEKEIK